MLLLLLLKPDTTSIIVLLLHMHADNQRSNTVIVSRLDLEEDGDVDREVDALGSCSLC